MCTLLSGDKHGSSWNSGSAGGGDREALLLLDLSVMEENIDNGIAGLKIAMPEFQK